MLEQIVPNIGMQQASISVFFPCYNDAQTIGQLVLSAGSTLAQITHDYEVIVVDDGSWDTSAAVLAALQQQVPYLRVIRHETNRGYGGALRSGFHEARKELVFYTDGDGQYDPRQLVDLLACLSDDVDVVQGWKLQRQDGLHRKVIGRLYHHAVSALFGLHLRDVDCDFRLLRRHVLDSFDLTSNSGSITVELMARVAQGGYVVCEVPVNHYARQHGRSQFFNLRRVAQTLWQLTGLWVGLRAGFQPAAQAGNGGFAAAASVQAD